jgi:Rrf2 family protein
MLSKKTQYALKALGFLAARYGDGPVLISEISQAKKIPVKFLETILLECKQAGILESKKGKGGGYYLAEHPKKVTLARAIRLVGGPIALIPCVSLNFYEKCADCDEATCGLYRSMLATRDATLKILEKRTLMELIDSK